jgi:hypothetical protein
MSAKKKRKPKTKPKTRLPASELGRMVHKVAALDRAVTKISGSIDTMEKQLRLLIVAVVCVVVAVAYVNYTKADAPDKAQYGTSKRR